MMVMRTILVLLVLVAVIASAHKKNKNKKGVTRQCSKGVCICVKKGGEPAYKGIKFPASESYNCKRKPKSCEKARFEAIFNGERPPDCNKKGKFVKKQCRCPKGLNCDEPPTPSPTDKTCRSVIIQSKNIPTSYFARKPGSNSFEIDPSAFKFNVITPGLTGEVGTVSFQSTTDPDKYLRHYRFLLYLEDKDNPINPASFEADATFILHKNRFSAGFVAFETVNIPNCYIRHLRGVLRVSRDDGTSSTQADSTWNIVFTGPTKPPPPPPPSPKICWCVDKKGKPIPGSKGGEDIKC